MISNSIIETGSLCHSSSTQTPSSNRNNGVGSAIEQQLVLSRLYYPRKNQDPGFKVVVDPTDLPVIKNMSEEVILDDRSMLIDVWGYHVDNQMQKILKSLPLLMGVNQTALTGSGKDLQKRISTLVVAYNLYSLDLFRETDREFSPIKFLPDKTRVLELLQGSFKSLSLFKTAFEEARISQKKHPKMALSQTQRFAASERGLKSA